MGKSLYPKHEVTVYYVRASDAQEIVMCHDLDFSNSMSDRGHYMCALYDHTGAFISYRIWSTNPSQLCKFSVDMQSIQIIKDPEKAIPLEAYRLLMYVKGTQLERDCYTLGYENIKLIQEWVENMYLEDPTEVLVVMQALNKILKMKSL